MSIYHFTSQIISRGRGRNVIAASAYRAVEKLKDEQTEIRYDYQKKERDIIFKEIILPEGASDKLKDREYLWNRVEKREKRKDSQLAREINLSLPRELTEKQNIELAKEYVKREFVSKGMIADVVIHKGKNQPHIHVMLTMRKVEGDIFKEKERSWNQKGLLQNWREEWANTVNRHLALNGHDLRIDHRSYKDQEVGLIPQSKIGPKTAYDRMARLQEHQEIARENGERIYQEPYIALDAITRQQSTFTYQDLARFINRHTVDQEQFREVYEKVKNYEEIIKLNEERLTTKEMLEIENKMLEDALKIEERKDHPLKDINITSNLNREQEVTLRYITGNKDLSCVIGYAGSGKSYLLKEAKELWEAEGYRVQGMTLSGIAAEHLESSSGIVSNTVANRIINWQHGREHLDKQDIVIVDETGMLGSRNLAKIIAEVAKAEAKLILVGDHNQLQAIEAGAPFRALTERVGYVELTEVQRQLDPIQKEATKDLALGNIEKALASYQDNTHVYRYKEDAMSAMVEEWDKIRGEVGSQIMLAHTNDDVFRLNSLAREIRKDVGELEEGSSVTVHRGEREFSARDLIYFYKNNKELGVRNGTLGVIKEIDKDTLRIDIPDKGEIKVDIGEYNYIDHGYATTVHKAQGITVDRTLILVTEGFDRHLTYVAMSRHRESLDIYYSKDQFLTLEELSQTLSRDRSKDMVIDYIDYANERDIVPCKIRDKEKFLNDLESFKILINKEWDRYDVKVEKQVAGDYYGNVMLDRELFGVIKAGDYNISLIPVVECKGLEVGDYLTIEKKLDIEHYSAQMKLVEHEGRDDSKFLRDLEMLGKSMKESAKFKYHDIDIGLEGCGEYHGSVTLDKEEFGMVECSDYNLQLVPAKYCEGLGKGDFYESIGKDLDKALDKCIDDKSKEFDLDREIGEKSLDIDREIGDDF